MVQQAEQRPRGGMAAERNTPWVSVSLLAEHTFCQRAGVIQHEAPEEDTGEDIFIASRSRPQTIYTIWQVKKEVRKWGIYTAIALAIAFAFGIFTVLSIAIDIWLSWESGLAVVITLGLGLLLFVAAIINLVCGLKLLSSVSLYVPILLNRGRIPFPNHSEKTRINWWWYINDGWEVRRPQDGYRDVTWHLVGCPWRILVKGDFRIPVFRKRASREASGERLYKQHFARMAAYCYLLEKGEPGAKSPYGIVLFGHSHTGETVPATPGTNKTFHEALRSTRQTIASLPAMPPPPPIDQQNRCLSCPHSWEDRTTLRSVCGARFNWYPPHKFRRY